MRGARTEFLRTAPVAAAGAILTLLAVAAWPLAALLRSTTPRALLELARMDEEVRSAFVWGLAQSTAATTAGVVFGLATAYCWARLRYPGRTLLRGLAVAPLAIPAISLAAGIEALFAPGTPASDLVSFVGLSPARLHSGTGAVIVSHGLLATAIVGWFASVAWASADARTVDAARTLGAGRIRAARVAVWPAVWPAALAGAGVAFLQSMLSYGVVLILARGRETPEGLSVRLMLVDDGRAAAVALLTVAYTLICGLVTIQLLRSPAGQSGRRRPPQPARGLDRLVALVAAVPAFLVAGAVVALLFRASGGDGGLTAAHWRGLMEGADAGAVRRAALGSLLAAVPAAALAAAWGGMAGAALGRMRGAGGMLRASALLLPLALSPAALIYGWRLASPGTDARVLLPLVQAAEALPFVAGTVIRMRPRWDPATLIAARTLGARRLRAWRVLRGPSYLIAAGVGFLVSFGLVFGEATVATVARVPGDTLPVRLLELDRLGAAGPAAALAAVILVVSVLAFTLGDPIIARLGRARR